ncbi:dTDP-4-dehydrorhamnose reductase [Thermodesulfobacteriota bacterium]
MKALITGANSQLGWELQQTKPDDFDIIALNRIELDITDSAAVASAIYNHQPDMIINAAAYTAVDRAEQEKDKAYAVNAKGAANIAKAALKANASLIHISTDFVFDGSASKPYVPMDKPHPLGIYGASKLLGEKEVTNITKGKALILRTSWLYSVHGSNFVKTMLRLMNKKNAISVVADQVGSPTWARDLATAIWHFASNPNVHGIYHYTNSGKASWYDFASAIQDEALELGMLEKKIQINPIKTEDFPTSAARPLYSVLDCTPTWETLGYTAPHWRDSLRKMLKELKDRS